MRTVNVVTNALTVLVVDDHPVVRRGLRAVLEDETWVDAVVEADTLAEAERQAVDHPGRSCRAG